MTTAPSREAPRTTSSAIDPVRLEIWWSRLVAVADEAAATMLRTAFSTIIRESNDYTVVLMDAAGKTVAECQAGIPAFAAVMGGLARHVLRVFPPGSWQEGDCVITNDPWRATGHLPDVAMICPIFHRGRLVGLSGTVAHVPDIGGRPTMGETDLRSEGLLIPPMRVRVGGRGASGGLDVVLANVEFAEQVRGDLEAQMAAHELCRRRVAEFLNDTGQADLELAASAIQAKSEQVMRAAIAALPEGVHRSSVDADGVDGQPTHIECAVTVVGDEITIDYAGSSRQVRHAVNCTLSYTRAYSVYPLKILLDPYTRRNEGSYTPISVTAPPGSILNANFPAPVVARHLTGHLLPCAIYGALASAVPERVIADSGGAPALRVRFAGRDASGKPWSLFLFASAGMGASASADGLSTTAFPTNSGAGSIESLEAAAPLLFTRKEFRADSGGAGTYRGGLGQELEVFNASEEPVSVVVLGDREQHPARGFMGGEPGATASVTSAGGTNVPLKSLTSLGPHQKLTISLAGGGGFGDPGKRDRAAVEADLAQGLITEASAEREYGLLGASLDRNGVRP